MPTDDARAARLREELARLQVHAEIEVLAPGRVAVLGRALRVVGEAEQLRAALLPLADETPEPDAWIAIWEAAEPSG